MEELYREYGKLIIQAKIIQQRINEYEKQIVTAMNIKDLKSTKPENVKSKDSKV